MTYTVDAMEEADLEELSDNVADFSDWLKGQGIALSEIRFPKETTRHALPTQSTRDVSQ